MKPNYSTAYLTPTEALLSARPLSIARMIIVSAIAMLSQFLVMAQDNRSAVEEIGVLARPAGDSIILRWAPLTYELWRLGNTDGYRIERYTITRESALISELQQKLLVALIGPLAEDRWEPLVTRSEYAAVAAQALFGDRFEVDLAQPDVLTIVNQSRENEQRFAFALFCADMSPEVARASGLWFADTSVRHGERYLYRVLINGTVHKGSVFTGMDDAVDLPRPLEFQAMFSTKTVNLKWLRDVTSTYTAFTVERKQEGKEFASISHVPLTTLAPDTGTDDRYVHVTDSLPDPEVRYTYRVRGITPFGEYGPPSDAVSGRSIMTTESVPYITSAVSEDNSSVLVKWMFPEASNVAIRGFALERSHDGENPFVRLNTALIEPHERTYRDTTAHAVNYYRIGAMTTDGTSLTSHVFFAQLTDSLPPAVPRGIAAAVDTAGHVTLNWTRNADTDIYGYRIYRSWTAAEEPAQITIAPIKDTIYVDTIPVRTLNRSAYYHVMAIDHSQNHSALSPASRVSLPDNVRPLPPILVPCPPDSVGSCLTWLAAGSDDVVEYQIFRNDPPVETWKYIATVIADNDSVYHYNDRTCAPRSHAFYTIISRDDTGLESNPTAAVKRICYPLTAPPPVKWRQHRLIPDQNAVVLSWQQAASQFGITSYFVYRSVNAGPFSLLRTVNTGTNELIDIIIPGNAYAYRIVGRLSSGATTTMSREITFSF